MYAQLVHAIAVSKLHKRLHAIAEHAEHCMAIGYAGAESFEAHALMLYASYGIMVFGIVAMLYALLMKGEQ